ncbi:hypothetical protein P43SY_007497 [Pythium insidiosum]|uniref:Uncharacterized protein n=1 Tax=Pythium insidiosum TaxID=114742 RepID=A0AAD5LW53_PYTIN|nr:hypothetical protein P43SY_007497 [Pythium insidiosum]
MDGDCTAIPLEELHEYVASLVQSLQWDPSESTSASNELSRSLQDDFVEALTEISALPSESIDMEVRRLLVDFGNEGDGFASRSAPHLDNLVAALSCRDVLLKCKAANAIGSICTSRVAGQRLLELKGDALLQSLIKMATCKNTWAQGDAFFVLGWIVVIADEEILNRLRRLVHTATRLLHKSLMQSTSSGSSSRAPKKRRARCEDGESADDGAQDGEPSEEEANRRIYCLVFLLNLSHRDPAALEGAWEPLVSALSALLRRLARDLSLRMAMRSSREDSNDSVNDQDDSPLCDATEWPELLRLTVTILCSLVLHVDAAAPKMSDAEMFAELQNLRLDLDREEAQMIFEADDVVDAQERLQALLEALASRDHGHGDARLT